MDAVKFIEERKRVCDMSNGCSDCPAFRSFGRCIFSNFGVSPAEQVEFVETWAAEHPPKTRQSVFLEQYPEAKIDQKGYLRVCPYLISITHRDESGGCANNGMTCAECRREFWSQEVE